MEDVDHPRYRALVIRKNADDLSDWVDRASRMFGGLGVKIAYRPAELKFPSGAIIKTGHLKDDQAYTKYQGHEYQRMLIEELTQIPEERRYLQLLASCRSTIKEIKPQVFCTTNPGGVGHGWVRARFVDPVPPNTPFLDPISGRSRIFIPATVEDNPTLMEADPAYVKQLDALKGTDVELWKAWRLGDWDTFAGQFFREFNRGKHVIPSFNPPKESIIVGGGDWGRVAPFACLLSTVTRHVFEGVAFNRVKTFLEVYGTDRTPKEWAILLKKKAREMELSLMDVAWISFDNRIFVPGEDKSISIYDQFVQQNPVFRSMLKPSSKDRIGGWANMHNWLSLAPDGIPYWQITDNCVNLIRTLPLLVHDENRVEDVDTDMEDHAPDAAQYMLKKLKWIDAGRSGGVIHGRPIVRARRAPEFIGDRQVGMDLSEWENVNKPNNKVGGVIRS